jgi:hypothetical protein
LRLQNEALVCHVAVALYSAYVSDGEVVSELFESHVFVWFSGVCVSSDHLRLVIRLNRIGGTLVRHESSSPRKHNDAAARKGQF